MKLIPLTRGKFAKVDDADFEFLSQWKWFAKKARKKFCVARTIYHPNGYTTVYMHRVLCGGIMVDHENGDPLDNQRYNLRPASHAENCQNQDRRENNTSGFKGVSRHCGRWMARIHAEGRRRYLGLFDSPVDAAHAYDSAAVQYFGEFSRLNFPATVYCASDTSNIRCPTRSAEEFRQSSDSSGESGNQ